MKRVLLLDDDIDLCTVVSEIILDLGSPNCLCIHSVDDLKKLDNKIFEFDVMLLDVNLGNNGSTGVDAYHWLVEKKYQGKIAFFTGHARSNPLVKKALEDPGISLIEKPAGLSEIQNLLV